MALSSRLSCSQEEGVDELAIEAGLDDGTCARVGRPRDLPPGLERVTLVEGAACVKLRGRPLDLVPRSALRWWAKQLLRLFSAGTSFFLLRK